MNPFAQWDLDPGTLKWIAQTRGKDIGPDPDARQLPPPMPAAPDERYVSEGGDVPDPSSPRYSGAVIGSPNGNAATPGSTVGQPPPVGPVLPYQPNPGLPGYQPNPGATVARAPAANDNGGAALGRGPRELTNDDAEASGDRLGSAAGAGAAAGLEQAAAIEGEGERERVANGEAIPRSPMYTTPAHWQPGTHEVHMQHGYSDDEVSPYATARGDAIDKAEQAGQTANAIGHMSGIAKAAEANAYSNLTQRYAEDRQQLEERKQRYVDMERQKLDELALQSQQKVDPEAYFKEKGTFVNVLAALAIGMGQFGASMRGGPNTAWDIIKSKIDANVRSQEQNISQAGKAYDIRSNLFKTNLDTFGDRERAIQATRINGLDQVHSMLAAKLADASLPLEERQAAQQLDEKIATERATALKEFMTLTHTAVSEASNEKFVPAQTVGGSSNAKPLPRLLTLTDGTTLQMPTDKSHDAAIAKIQAHGQLQAMDKRALAIRAELDDLSPGTAQYTARVDELKKMAIDRIYQESDAMGQGVVKKDEMEQQLPLSPYLKGIGESFLGGYQQRYLNPLQGRNRVAGDNEIRTSMERSNIAQRALVIGAGGSIVKRGFSNVPGGGVTPTAEQTGQYVKPDQNLAPNGFKPFDPRVNAPTQGAPLSETAPFGPFTGQTVAPPSSSGGKKKGDKLKTGKIK